MKIKIGRNRRKQTSNQQPKSCPNTSSMRPGVNAAEFGMPAHTDNAIIVDAGYIYWSLHIVAFATNMLFVPGRFSPSLHILNAGWIVLIGQI